jgi:hypothetical protein
VNAIAVFGGPILKTPGMIFQFLNSNLFRFPGRIRLSILSSGGHEIVNLFPAGPISTTFEKGTIVSSPCSNTRSCTFSRWPHLLTSYLAHAGFYAARWNVGPCEQVQGHGCSRRRDASRGAQSAGGYRTLASHRARKVPRPKPYKKTPHP